MIIPRCEELQFDERKHIYSIDGVFIPSVTTIMRPLSNELYRGIDEAVLSRAAERGSAVHTAIENLMTYGIEDIPMEYEGYLKAFKSWRDEYKPEVHALETRVHHKAFHYAGTVDMVCTIGGKTTIVDYKTSAQVNSCLTGVQLEAYSRAYASNFFNAEAKAILHLKRNGSYDFIEYGRLDNDSWSVFAACLTIYNHMQRVKRG